MKFVISRTSLWDASKCPCEEAKRDSVTREETYRFHTPEEYDKYHVMRHEGNWLSIGTNHRVNKNGYITRDNGMMDVWSIEINSLEELIEFVDKYGEIVIYDSMGNSHKEIEIYDDWRE